MVELTTQHFSHSSKSEVLLPFQHRMFLCDTHTVRYSFILFTDFKFETDQIMEQSVLHCNGKAKDVFENSRGHLTFARQAAGCVSVFYRLYLEDRARDGEKQ